MSEPIASLVSLSNSIADLVDGAAQGIVALHGARRWPLSGLHWRPGVIVTAEEGLERDDDITVLLPDGRKTSASLAGRDPTTDIAVLRFQPDGLKTVATGDAAALRAGNIVAAVGRNEAGPVASFGIAAIAGGVWQSRRGGTIDRLIRLDLRLSPSGEGGAMVDAAGQVLGMTVPGPRRIVLGIPGSTIDRVVDQLLAKGYIARGYLGAGLRPVRHGANGVLIVSIDPAGPAASAGLLVGDIITQWNGQDVSRVRAIMQLLGPESVGGSVALKLIRGGAPLEKSITIGERPRR
jgi:S1-C subfamily serine protease